MIKNIVFDTNIWLNFIERIEINYLEILWNKVENKGIKIILPENIEQEFNKKKDSVRSKIIQSKPKEVEEINSVVESILSLFEVAEKLKTIDSGVSDWVNSGKAPNHTKNNYEDTCILNTLLGLPKSTSFYLIANDSDYRIDKNNYELHPDIIEKFEEKSIEVLYYADYQRFFAEANLIPKQVSQNSNELYSYRAFKLKVSNKDIFNQLKEAIDYYYKELNFIPLNYLSNIYPFNSSSQTQTYFNGTTLIINNISLFEFFEKSLIQYKNKKSRIRKSYFKSDDEIEQYRKVLKTLNDNLMFYIRYKNKTIRIEIERKTESPKKCDCHECTLNRNEIHLLKKKCDSDNSKNPKDLLKKAYYYYKSGHLSEALKLYNNILKTIDKKDYPIINFIVEYNRDIMRGMWMSGDSEFAEERNKLRPKNENKLLNAGISSIAGYIKYSKFFDYDFFEVIQDYEKAKSRFDAHNGLGNSYMSNLEWKNILRWSELYQFIRRNGIMFDRYTNIENFAKYTLKIALLASVDRVVKHPISFYILKTTINYLPLKEIKNCFLDLKLSTLHYSIDDNKHLFNLYSDKIKSLDSTIKLDSEHPYLEEHIKDVEKVVFIQAYLKFSKKQHNFIISKLIDLIKSNDLIKEKLLPFLKPLANNKTECFNKKNAELYINLVLQNEQTVKSGIMGVFNLIDKKGITLNTKNFKFLLNDNIEEKTGYYRGYIFLSLFENGTKKQKEIVLDEVHNILTNESLFDYKLYDFFTSERVITCKQKYLVRFKSLVDKDFSNESTKHYSNINDREISKIESLNYFINHIYQFYSNEVYENLKDFKGRSDYYDFLISPKEFETSKIDIHWFYIAYRSSFLAIKNIIGNKEINNYIIEKILKSNNEKYFEAYIKLKKQR